MKLDTYDEINKLSKSLNTLTEKLGIDMKNDLFEIVQPYKNGESITFKVDEDDEGKRNIKVNVFDNTHILPVIESELDFYN